MDIVEQLRNKFITVNHDEAADEIERLRAEVTRLTEKLDSVTRAYEIEQKACFDLTEKVIPNLREQLATAKLEGFNEGIESAALHVVINAFGPRVPDLISGLRALKREVV